MVVPLFTSLMEQRLQGVNFFHLVDDSLIRDVIKEGSVSPKIAWRVLQHIILAVEGGADYVIVTCSSVGEVAEWATKFVPVPVIRVDKPMAEYVVQTASKIGVLATLPTTLSPTMNLIKRSAESVGREVEVEFELCDAAFNYLKAERYLEHDELIRDGIRRLSRKCEVVVLAQASMARVLESMSPGEVSVPVLSSPPLLVDYLKKVLNL